MFNYDVGIGGQEDPHNKETRENIYPLPDNRTLFVEQFTDAPPSEPKMERNCTKIEDVFALYQPELFVSLLDEQGQTVAEQFRYKGLGDFHPAQLVKRSAFLKTLEENKEDFEGFKSSLLNNRVLQSILADPEMKEAYLTVIDALLEDMAGKQAA